MPKLKWRIPLLFLLISGFVFSALAQKPKTKEEEPASAPASEPAVEYPKPEKVKVGIYINDIQNLDIKSHSYELDLYIWFRWKNPDLDPATTMEILNPSELWGHIVNLTYEGEEQEAKEGEEPITLPGISIPSTGERYQVVRVQGRFSKKFPLYNYPYDDQTLVVRFEDTASVSSDVMYELDALPLSMNPNIKLPGFEIGTPTFKIEEHQYPTTFGDLRIENNLPEKYSSGLLEIPITRPQLPYSIKLLAPIFCVIICAALMFLLSPVYVDSRVDVGITSLLTVVALQMTFNQDLPDVGYLMLMDKIYLLSYLFVIGGLAVVVITSKMAEQKKEEQALKLHKLSLIGLSSFYILASAILVIWAAIEG
jgi:hypothetical protein